MIDKINLKDALKKAVLDGFETYDDYVKYGDAITPIQRSNETSRALVLRRRS